MEGVHFCPISSKPGSSADLSVLSGFPPTDDGDFGSRSNEFLIRCSDQKCGNGWAALTAYHLEEIWTNGDTPIRKIGGFACSWGLTRVSFPEVTTMDFSCFRQCTELTSISLPSLSDDFGFNGEGLGCRNLKELHIESLPMSAVYANHNCSSGSAWHGMPDGVSCFCRDGVYITESD